jgi:protein required for attachment to host cells
LPKQTTWVLVSDAAGGRFFEVSDEQKLVPTYKREIASEVLASREIDSDKPGRAFDSGGQGRHSMEPPTDPKRHAKAEMAHTLCEALDGQRKKNAFDRLIVVAPPQFLGDLRDAMPKPLQELVVAEVTKDLSHLKPHQLEAQLADVLKVKPPL